MDNRQWLLAERPSGLPTKETFKLQTLPVPTLAADQILVRTLYLSVDPYMRGRMRNVRSYVPPYELNAPIQGDVVGEVVESRAEGFRKGDRVAGRLEWAEYCVAGAEDLRKISLDDAMLPAALGILGMPGLTAYFALLDVGKPQSGETVLISGAAGAVGLAVGQIAKLKGCRAVGIAGSDEKVRLLTEDFGFDAAFNYKSAKNFKLSIHEHCPNGVDIYFDNVGGEISDAAVTQLNRHARVIVCGQISIYNREKTEMGPRNWLHFLVARARLEGFLVMDYEHRYPEGLAELAAWIKQGKIKYRETLVDGFERAPDAFLGLFNGDNIGKMVVKVATPTTSPA